MGEFIYKLPLGWNSMKMPDLEELVTWVPIAVVVALLLICFLGFRFCVSACFFSFSVLSGFIGVHYARPYCHHSVSVFIVFTICTAFGGWLVYVFVNIWNSMVKKLRLRKAAIFVFTYVFQVINAIGLVLMLYKFFYTGIVLDIVAAVAFTLLGFLVQKKTGILDRDIRSYEDSLQI
ncbi:MAG: hypothetical protein J5856_02595 [Lachnospiraceae bacterium]|nr:hypothetical protein [Lachnospiraceae bacterium]